MKEKTLLSLLAGFFFIQNSVGQNLMQLARLKPKGMFDNVQLQKLYSDQHTSSFVIWIKKEVKAHKHIKH